MANDDKVRILPYDRIYKNFIDPKFIPEGKDEYYHRDEQTPFQKEKWRHLRADEIESLVINKNVAISWDDILVTDEFDPKMVKRNSFFGLVNHLVGTVSKVNFLTALFILSGILFSLGNGLINIILGHIGV